MPVIIDELDVVDTEPASGGAPPVAAQASGGGSASPGAIAEQVTAAIRINARRAARVRAD